MELRRKLTEVQNKLKVPKNLFNNFGKYNYRNCESIMEAVKPILAEAGLTLYLKDDVIEVGGRIYIKATAVLSDEDSTIEVSALARESIEKKGMDESQITGTASSYARKYCLNGLFLIDDTKDADTDEFHAQTNRRSDDVEEIIVKLTEDKIAPEFVCKLYKISSLKDMTDKQAANLKEHYKELKEAYKKENQK